MAIKHSGCQARGLVIAGKSLKSKGNRALQGYADLGDRQSFDENCLGLHRDSARTTEGRVCRYGTSSIKGGTPF
jgi:hypothetical protein